MMIEKILFNIIAFTLFIILFFKFVRKNDTSYIIILGIEFVGILLNFIELVVPITWNIIVRIIMYIFAIIIPVAVILLEKRGYEFSVLSHLSQLMFGLYQFKIT